ncbi:MAG: TrmH family RNA methyltransferase [Pseudodesulfovibrio sp.]|jgi:23S rRNA (guanosine2251-2'-O)-methyltransferase|uniref:23S rRNA (Guanosine2251-2'-O)-methyltransferase n=1 Tax=Pseudodesulfovibrio indicus TaxID=1716143 RepID=A0A126QJL3_9BACT|nr:TrmH family RNA methyltransferase [Pseudodesulfovibrio indicus]AMK10180.1 RNA methyltransferase [Pseudodesulfovibrio indicus]TDT87888.1 23S rRNA (guanosine2251-2'-O)-methyltransferase [Pseudodesulfovibrio indicus]
MQDHDRDKKDGKIYVVGNKPVKELLLDSPQKVDFVAFRKGRRDQAMEEILELCRTQNVPYKSVGPKDLDYMYRGNHQGVAARCAALDYVPLEKLLEIATEAPLPLIVALDQVQDTGNVGVLARTVHALGGAGLIVCQHHGAYIGAGAVRSSAGALTQLPVAKVGNLANAMKDCVNYDYTLYCARMTSDSDNVYTADLETPAVLILGNEEKGVRPGVAKFAHHSLHIPFQREFDSLNVAQAGAIIVSEFARRLG